MSIMLFLVVFVSVAYAKHQANPINEEYWKYYDLDTEYVTTKTNISLDIMKLMKDRNGIEEPGKASEYHFSIYRNGDIISFGEGKETIRILSIENLPEYFSAESLGITSALGKYYYEYELKEAVGGKKIEGVSYDDKPITLEIFVNNTEETSNYGIYYKNQEGEYIAPATFVNYYSSTDPKVDKTVHDQEEYPYGFRFIKEWSGEPTGNVSFKLYQPDGTEIKDGYKKNIISLGKNTWEIEYEIKSKPVGYYVIENISDGYFPTYLNIDKYKEFKDRIYDGGTIINTRIPTTGDNIFRDMIFILAALGVSGVLLFMTLSGNRKKV